MKLQNPFPVEKRELFRDYQYKCWECGKNGSDCGGTELHHILGRVSSSVFNGAVLCKRCHNLIGHTFEEESKLLKKTEKIVFLQIKRGNYILDEDDRDFFYNNQKYYK